MNTIKKFIQKLLAPRVDYQPLIEVRVFKDVLLRNLLQYQQKYPQLQFAPVLKSNAYGHGLTQVAGILDHKMLPFFMVDSFYEALVLRREGIKTKIVILGYNRKAQILNNHLEDCSFGIVDLQQLKIIADELTSPQTFHLKLDTGMHRQGIMEQEVGEAMELIKSNPNIILEGLCSHFADADSQKSDFTEKQITLWNHLAEKFKKEFSDIKYFHLSNTAGAAYAQKITANVSRLGIGLFGFNTSTIEKLDLHPALQMTSIISSIKNISAGDKVGYGITFAAPKDMIVATVPVGYNEGVDRRLSNKGFFKVGKVFCPLAGRVSMNMSSIDVTDVPNVKLEDEVIVISEIPADKNSVENMAKACECLPYEVLVKIPGSLRRIVV